MREDVVRIPLLLCALAVTIPVAPVAGLQEPSAVFVRPTTLEGKKRQRVDPRPQKELDQRLKIASDSVDALEKAFRKAFGKKREEWSPEARQQFADASQRHSYAAMEALYAEVNPEDVKQVEKWLVEAIVKDAPAALLRIAPSLAEADLVLDVRGVRSQKTVDTYLKDNDCRELFTLMPGERPNADAWFAGLPREWAPTGLPLTSRLFGDSSRAPAVLIDASSGAGSILRCWGKSTDAAIEVIRQLRRALSAHPPG